MATICLSDPVYFYTNLYYFIQLEYLIIFPKMNAHSIFKQTFIQQSKYFKNILYNFRLVFVLLCMKIGYSRKKNFIIF